MNDAAQIYVWRYKKEQSYSRKSNQINDIIEVKNDIQPWETLKKCASDCTHDA